jgi:ferrous iron transport protein B
MTNLVTADRPDGHGHRELLIALAGQPNVGKSTVFTLLTGLSQHVGNWPGKTVERREGALERAGTRLRIVDLPGTYALSAASVEEQLARQFIIHDRPDVVVVLADASALERNLYLLAEFLALDVPLVLGLNMMDVAEAQGVQVESHVLEAALGLPVVPLVATRNEGVAELIAAAERVAQTPAAFHPRLPQISASLREVLAQLHALVAPRVRTPYRADWVALKLLEGDREVTEEARGWLDTETWGQVDSLIRQHEDAIVDVAAGRYEWIERMVRAAVRRPRLGQISLTDRIDRVAVHPFWGLLVLAGVFAFVFWLTFTVAAPLQRWLDVEVVGGLRRWSANLLASSPTWIGGLVNDGILNGAGLVLTFLPVLAVFFTALALLEDTGYLARTGYLMDRFMHRLGLHGRSFLALFLGFGCNVPAVMATRVIETRSGRLLTILLAPFVPCGARLMVLAFLTPAFFGDHALLVSWSLVMGNLLILAVVGIVLSQTLFRGQHGSFIMALPLYHVPNARSIAALVWHFLLAFLRNAASVILLVSVIVWALSSFPDPEIETSYLAQLGHWLAPIGGLMGLDWRMLTALVTSFVAKENAIATLAVLYANGHANTALVDTLTSQVAPASALAFLVVTMLFVPCAATVAVTRQETRSWRWTLFSVLLPLVLAFAAGVLVYQSATWLQVGL